MAIGVSPLIPTTNRPGFSVIPTNDEMLAAANNNKSVTPALVADHYIGYYSTTRQYTPGKCVFFDGNFYSALLDSQGISPLNPVYWQNSFVVDTSNFVTRTPGGGIPIGANWVVAQEGANLVFRYNGAVRVVFESSGLIGSVNDVAAFATYGP